MPGNSIIHRLDPRVKFIILVFLTIIVFTLKNFFTIGVLFVVVMSLWFIARMPVRIIGTYLKFMLVLFLILIVMQAIFYQGETTLVKPLIPEKSPVLGGKGQITLEGILFGLLLCLRVLTLICMLPVLLMTTTIEKMSLALVKMGLPYKVAFTATTSLNQLPILRSEAVQIMNAQKLRGFTVFETGRLFQKLKAFPTLIVPLVMGAMRRANMMAVAMDSRAFGAGEKRSYIVTIEMEKKDWIILILGILFGAVLCILNFILAEGY